MPRRNSPPERARGRAGSSRQRHQAPAHKRARIGQHFLADPLVASDIVQAAGLSPDGDVIEVGPGKGALTGLLLERVAHVTAVELDEYLADSLRRTFTAEGRLTVIASSILDHPADVFLAEGGRRPPFQVVANLPYYITAPVLRHFLEPPAGSARPHTLVVMVQREVAESIAGLGHGLSLLGVSVQVFGSARLLFRVPPSAFSPPPRVDSAVVRIDVYPEPLVDDEDLEGFFAVVRAGYRSPRKQLHNSISTGLWMPPGSAPGLLLRAGIDPARRPATLTIPEWMALHHAYQDLRASGDAPAWPAAGEPGGVQDHASG